MKRIFYNNPDSEFVFCAGDDKVRVFLRAFGCGIRELIVTLRFLSLSFSITCACACARTRGNVYFGDGSD